jgi:hypothetical protein
MRFTLNRFGVMAVQDGNTALMIAATTGDSARVQLMLDAGCDAGKQSKVSFP